MKKPCVDCPFKKTSLAGYLGGRWEAIELHRFVMSEGDFACHNTIKGDQEIHDKLEHCVGSILYMNKNAKRCSHNTERKAIQESLKGESTSDILNLVEFCEHHKDAKITISKDVKLEAECEDCDWKGSKDEMPDQDDSDFNSIQVCPNCASENIYYF